MEGFILQYRASSPQDILRINTKLLGRVVTVNRNNKDHYYYYRGLLHDVGFYKLSNGCYFVTAINQHLSGLANVKITIADIDIKPQELINGRIFFMQKFEGKRVNNL